MLPSFSISLSFACLACFLAAGLFPALVDLPPRAIAIEDGPSGDAPAGGNREPIIAIEGELFRAGAAQADITPEGPIRLNGFGFRRAESEGVAQRIKATALAIEDAEGRAALLYAVDSLGLPDELVERVARRLATDEGIPRERIAITFTHSHTTPMVRGASPTIFGEPIPADHLERIDRYTARLENDLVRIGREALADRRPARIGVGRGEVGFARNRRTAGGPVDHDLPVLAVVGDDGRPIAICATYACHCVTLSFNHVSGDWAGYAREAIEAELPGAHALITIGCGADANPDSGVTGGNTDEARRQAREIASEVRRVLSSPLRSLSPRLECVFSRVELPFAAIPDRKEWERRATLGGATGHHARVQLERLDRGEEIRTKIDYPIGTWTFGEDLAMVFLAGEVVVDYALRLDRELDAERLWVHGYTNDFPFYIPSERILREGGYEGGGAHVYFDVPGPFAPGLEDAIVAEVRRRLPAFRGPHAGTDGHPPRSPDESLRAMRIDPAFDVELVAAEPLVIDPVAIDFGADGRLWVAEMRDYPSGIEGKPRGGGCVRVLADSDGDGVYDDAKVFLDDVPFPTGVTAWRDAVLVCAAPDILLARDANGDGVADEVRKLYSGFATHNYQARVNSLTPSLDNWLHGATGLFGGRIRSFSGVEISLEGRDFRIRPESGAIEAVAGRSQQGRVRNDEGDWFGCENGSLAFHFPLDDRFTRRNPWTVPPPSRAEILRGSDPGRLYPAGGNQVLFALSGPPGRVTAACGIGVYRDELLGDEFRGSIFTCEPVSGVVHRRVLAPRGSTFDARRAPGEETREFLASEDNWFRPVQARTGPDGALYIADMVRYVIEHPVWIPPERVANLDVRAGDDRGRIWRVVPRGRPRRDVPNLPMLSSGALVEHLASPNGIVRDRAQEILVSRKAREVVPRLEALVDEGESEHARLHALGTLDGLEALSERTLRTALADRAPSVRRFALDLVAEHPLRGALVEPVVERARDADERVVLAAACALGEIASPDASVALAGILERHGGEPWIRGAALSSALPHLGFLLGRVGIEESKGRLSREVEREIVAIAAAGADDDLVAAWFERCAQALDDAAEGEATDGSTERLLERAVWWLEAFPAGREPPAALARIARRARDIVRASEASLASRIGAIGVLGWHRASRADDLDVLVDVIASRLAAPELRVAALRASRRIEDERVPETIFASWQGFSPRVRLAAEETLLSRPLWERAWLAWLEQAPEGAISIDPIRRDRWLSSGDEDIRERAERIFRNAVDSDRASVVARAGEEIAGLAGDRHRGRAVFAEVCATCHRLAGVGRDVGPPLAELTDRSKEALLVAILDPNRAVLGSWVSYSAVLDDGQVLSGIIADETSTSVTIVGADGETRPILRERIARLESSGRSLMPEGLESTLDAEKLADVIEFVRRAAPEPLGSGTPAEHRAARRAFRAEGPRGLARLIEAAETHPNHASWLGPLPIHVCRQRDGEGRVVWETSPVASDADASGRESFLLAAAMGWRSQPAGHFELRAFGRTLLRFELSLEDARWESDDGRVALDWVVLQRNAEDAVGRLTVELDRSLVEPGEPVRLEVRGSASRSERWFGVFTLPEKEEE